nr:MAG TPA: hypothetical protein [Caudoviricetes sp.]
MQKPLLQIILDFLISDELPYKNRRFILISLLMRDKQLELMLGN